MRGATSLGLAACVLAMLPPARARAEGDTHACVEAAHRGQELRDGGKLTAARETFLQCIAPSCPSVVRESCERWVSELDVRLPSIVFGARDEAGADLVAVRVIMDGAPLVSVLDGRSMTVDPGPHELVFEAEGFSPVKQFVVAREGERVRTVVATLKRSGATASRGGDATDTTTPRPRNVPALLVSGGVTILGAAGFAVFGVLGQGEKDDLRNSCAPSRTCASGDVDGARTKLIVADVSLGVGIVSAAVFTGFLLAPLFEGRRHAPAKASAVRFGAAPLPGGASGSLVIRY